MKKQILLALITIAFVSFIYHRQRIYPLSQLPTFRYFYGNCTAHLKQNLETEAPPILSEAPPSLTETDLKIIEIFNKINETMPTVPYLDKNRTTSAEKSRATIKDPKDRYCVGDPLTVQLSVYDFSGTRKNYGGDFLRARIYSPEVRAGASGTIEDLNNGTYHVRFTLFWEGNIRVSLLLMHSSEGASALWRARNKGYKNVYWTGKFASVTGDVHTECGLQINTTEEVCEYPRRQDGEVFYCIKPAHVPCDALTQMKASFRQHSYLSDSERSLFDKSNNGVEIKKLFENISVLNCNKTLKFVEEKCKPGMSSPFPSGYYLRNVWRPVFCAVSPYNMEAQLGPCLKGKLVYLMGDSTMRQWMLYFPRIMKGLKMFDLHGNDWHKNLLALDMDRNLQIMWKKHGHPFVTMSFFSMPNDAYIMSQIDELVGGRYTVVAITLAIHFRSFPLEVFIRRMINVRKAVERLLRRSPETKVIVKTENTRELNADAEHSSDFHGYVQYLAMNLILQGLNVGLIDAWDMTIAFASQNAHPSDDVIGNQVNMFLTYMC